MTCASLAQQRSPLIPDDPVLVDPRKVREQLPEFNERLAEGKPDAAEYVQRETEYILRDVVERANAQGRNLVICGYGDGPAGAFASRLLEFADAGYEVRVLLVDCSIEESRRRNEARAEATGLRYDADLLAAIHRNAAAAFLDWKDMPGLAFEMYSTDQPSDA